MDAQYLDQFSVDSLQEFNLRTNLAQLPKQNAIASDYYSNQKGKAESQVTTDVESIKNRASARLPHPATPEVLANGPYSNLLQGIVRCRTRCAGSRRAPETLPTLFYFGTRFRLGSPVLKPVIRTNSRSNDAAASGARLWPSKTECTA
jgi:hypothetical protein